MKQLKYTGQYKKELKRYINPYPYGMIRKTILLCFFDLEPIQNYSRNKKMQGTCGDQGIVLTTLKKLESFGEDSSFCFNSSLIIHHLSSATNRTA